MKINLSKSKAIELLQKRIEELNKFDYEPDAWQSKVKTDVEAIFGNGSKVIDIIKLPLDTPYKQIQNDYRRDGKVKAKSLLLGFIQTIEEHVPNSLQSHIKSQDQELFETKVALIDKNNQLQKSLLEIQKSNAIAEENRQKDIEIQRLKDSIWQIEGVNIPKLWRIFLSLKLAEQIAVITFFITLLGISFFVGVFFQKNHWLG